MKHHAHLAGRVNSRRGSGAFKGIVALLLVAIAGIGGFWWYSTQPGKVDNKPAKPVKSTEDQTKDAFKELMEGLEGVVKDKAVTPDALTKIGANFDFIADLKEDLSAEKTGPELVTKLAPTVMEYKQKLLDILKTVLAIPIIGDQIKPYADKIMPILEMFK